MIHLFKKLELDIQTEKFSDGLIVPLIIHWEGKNVTELFINTDLILELTDEINQPTNNIN